MALEVMGHGYLMLQRLDHRIHLRGSMAELDTSGFTFTTPPTKAETERFEYVAFDYIADNPGTVGGVFSSLIGVYYSSDGEVS